MTGAVVRVSAADDHPVYRDGLVPAWRDHPRSQAVASVGDGHAALAGRGIGGQELLETRSEDTGARPIILTDPDSATVISPIARRGLADALRARTEQCPALTRREIDILARAADGGTTRDIAGELHIGAATAKTHPRYAYEKLGVSDRAAAQAIRRGLL